MKSQGELDFDENDDVDTSSHNNMLFIILPNEEVSTLKHLPCTITTYQIKAHMELICGIPAQLFTLHMPSGDDLSDKEEFTFGREFQSGTILRTRLLTSWYALYSAVCRNDIQEVVDNGGVRMADNAAFRTKDAVELHQMIAERAFVALFIASNKGFAQMCKVLVSIGANLHMQTPFGRTILHAAAAQDHLPILQMLIRFGAEPNIVDFQEKTTLAVAISSHAYTCETWMRLHLVNLCGGKRPKSSNSLHSRPDPWQTSSRKYQPESTLRMSTSVGHAYFVPPENEQESVQFSATNARLPGSSRNKDSHSRQYSDDNCVVCSMQHVHTPTPPCNGELKYEKHRKSSSFHKHCSDRPPFVTLKHVEPNIQYSSTVEYVPVELATYNDQQDEPQDFDKDDPYVNHTIKSSSGLIVPNSTPRNSATDIEAEYGTIPTNSEKEPTSDQRNSLQDVSLTSDNTKDDILDNLKQINGHVEKVVIRSSFQNATKPRRAASAKYPNRSDSSVSITYGENIKRRPMSAVTQSKTSNRKTQDLITEERAKRNKEAFEDWLARKRRGSRHNSFSNPDNQMSSVKRRDLNNAAYQKWLDKKEGYFEELEDKKQKELRGEKSIINDKKRMTIFQLENTDPTPVVPPPVSEYARAYHIWLKTREKKSSHKERKQRVASAPPNIMQRKFEEKRRNLLTEAITYEEWLDLKSEEESIKSEASRNEIRSNESLGKPRSSYRLKSPSTDESSASRKVMFSVRNSFPEANALSGDENLGYSYTHTPCTPRVNSYQKWTFNKNYGCKPQSASGGRKKVERVPSATPLVISQYVYPEFVWKKKPEYHRSMDKAAKLYKSQR